ncbi:hypothetical protein [Agriterribacter sp.]|uniref:hypothetical protein n=1 Tax=Agriterribacter sp. TaxID=2821509 RepID=UPI002B69928D|nr:hypothetical protein [Agriterribacter sp.]HRP55238.1 hypothetical protein [Agriterribacter sp.]
MEFKEFEKCLYVIGYWINMDKSSIKLLNENIRIVEEYVTPFSKELNTNLLLKDTFEAKRDLIRYYIFEFRDLQGFFKENKEILFTGSRSNYGPLRYEYTNEKGRKRKLNEYENYVINSHELFDMMIHDIQLCCIKYKIDFFEVCDELYFSTEIFDSGISIGFEQIQKESLPPQQTETKTEQETPTFANNFDNITPIEIYKHFEVGLVEKGYLTKQELNEYLKAAFELKTKPETLFKLKHTPTKQKIYTVFYVYYKDIAQKKHQKQKEYAALLGDYFEGYKTEIIQTNWARDYKTKR